MWRRLLVATTGALLITAGILLGLNEFTKLFREHDSLRYFRITDYIPAPAPTGKPDRPPAVELPPARPALRYEQSLEEPPRLDEAPRLDEPPGPQPGLDIRKLSP